MMNILVTGGAGFLGREFVKHHQEQGNRVLAIDNLSNPFSYFPKKTEKYVCDLQRMPIHVRRQHFDRIYHFAAPVGGREKIEGDPMYNAESLAIDSFLFRWVSGMEEKPVILYPSSSAVYPVEYQNGRANIPSLVEFYVAPTSSTWYPPDEMYGFTKFAGEYMAYKAEKYGVTTLCIRPFSGYGEEQSLEYPFPSIIQRFIDHETPMTVWGDGTQSRDFIHVDDIVGATEAILEAHSEGYKAINIGSGVETSFLSLIDRISDVIGYKVPVKTMPEKPAGVMRRVSDNHAMLKYYTPKVGLDEGIRRVLQWRLENG